MFYFIVVGIILGLSAGFSPGPLLTLVISETLQHGVRSGVKVALAPIVTDLPIIIVSMLLLAKLSDIHPVLGFISLLGGCFLLFLGIENMHVKDVEMDFQENKLNSLSKGIITNVLSPHPYLFWLSVGAPIMTKAMDRSLYAPFVFISSFYIFLVGSKIILAISFGHSRQYLRGHAYLYTMRFLGLLLCVLALFLFQDGLMRLNLIQGEL